MVNTPIFSLPKPLLFMVFWGAHWWLHLLVLWLGKITLEMRIWPFNWIWIFIGWDRFLLGLTIVALKGKFRWVPLGEYPRYICIYTHQHIPHIYMYRLYSGCKRQYGVVLGEQLLGYPSKGTQNISPWSTGVLPAQLMAIITTYINVLYILAIGNCHYFVTTQIMNELANVNRDGL